MPLPSPATRVAEVIKGTGASTLPAPADLVRHQRPPLGRRLRALANTIRHSSKMMLVAVFVLFVLVGTLLIHVFEGGGETSPFDSFFNALWFTVVTMTTVGYGDISPTHPVGRLWAIVEMLVGIGLVGIITGGIASMLVEGHRRRALGLASLTHVEDHIVVCGWKRDLRNVLLGILDADPLLSAHDIVLVTTRPPNDIGDLRRERKLRSLHYIYGSHTDRSVLEMARVELAQRVIILADETARDDGSQSDSRTVLAATAVEAINSRVYTCTEIIQPHYIAYLKPAGVEEVVLEQRNARALITAASLGDGLATVLSYFHPERGQQLRVLDIPPHWVNAPYGDLEQEARGRGFLPLGLLENTGRLHDRKHERIEEALRQPDYRKAVDLLKSVGDLTSNVPVLAPEPDTVLRSYAKLVVLLPNPEPQPDDQRQRRLEQHVLPRSPQPEHLAVCGWKADMAGLLRAIRNRHEALGRELSAVTVLGTIPDAEAQAVMDDPELRDVRIVQGDATQPRMLARAGLESANRVLVLADPAVEAQTQEADARNVMISFAVSELNPAAYKCVEVMNPSFLEHLRRANVEEPILTRQYQRLMLVQISLGTGLSSAIGTLIEPGGARLRVVNFADAPAGTSLGEHARLLAEQGLLLVGAMDHTGNSHARKTEYIRQAQVQSRVKGSVEHLRRLKSAATNMPVIHPGDGFVPGVYSRALVIGPPLAPPADV